MKKYALLIYVMILIGIISYLNFSVNSEYFDTEKIDSFCMENTDFPCTGVMKFTRENHVYCVTLNNQKEYDFFVFEHKFENENKVRLMIKQKSVDSDVPNFVQGVFHNLKYEYDGQRFLVYSRIPTKNEGFKIIFEDESTLYCKKLKKKKDKFYFRLYDGWNSGYRIDKIV